MSLYDDASLIAYPSGYKESKIYTQKPVNGTGDLTFTRASSATRVNAEGLIETAAIFGSELIVNGDFATDTDWNKGSGSTISGGNLNIISAPYNATTRQTISLTSGITYQILINATAVGSATANTFQLGFGDSSGNPSSATQHEFAVGISTKTLTVTASATDTTIIFRSRDAGTSNLTIHSVSVKEYTTSNIPRIDYSNGCGSLLLEPQRTNVAEYSNAFSSWGIYGTPTITSGQSFPFAAEDSTKVEFSTSGSFIRLLNVDVSSGTHTISFWAKKSVSSSCLINADGKTGTFNFDTGVFASGTATGNMVALTDGWFKCTMTFLGVGATAQIRIQGVAYPFGAYFFGFQIEAGSYPTSYIPTSGTTVTRLQDTSSTTGLSSVINSTEGVLYAEISALADDLTNRFVSINNGSKSERVMFGYSNVSNKIFALSYVGNVIQCNITFVLPNMLDYNKIALKYKANDFALWINGVEVGIDLVGSVSASNTLNRLSFDEGDGTDVFYSNVQNLMLFPSALTDDELADLTGAVHQTFNSLATFYGYTIL